MIAQTLIPLAQKTLRSPRAAADEVIGFGLGRDILWTAFALVAIVNTVMVLLVVQVSDSAVPLPTYFSSPLALFLVIAGLMAVYVYAMHWSAQAIGGEGDVADMLALVVWFQVLRAAAQICILLLSMLIPALGMILSIVVAIWGVWIFLNFVAAAGKLPGVAHSVLVLIIAAVGLVLGVGVLTAVIGLVLQGVM